MSDGIKIAIKSGISAQDKIRGTEKKGLTNGIA